MRLNGPGPNVGMLGTAVHSFIVHGLSQSLTLLPLYVLNPGNRRLLNSSESCHILPEGEI